MAESAKVAPKMDVSIEVTGRNGRSIRTGVKFAVRDLQSPFTFAQTILDKLSQLEAEAAK